MTTSDGQYLLICQKRDEGRQLYTLNLHNGEIRQITEGDGVGQERARLGLCWQRDLAIAF